MDRYSLKNITVALSILIGAQSYALTANAAEGVYNVTVTNITRGVSVTPLLVVTHRKESMLFKLGQPASHELAVLAESGNIQPLRDSLFAQGEAFDAVTNGARLPPGQSVTLKVKMDDDFDRVSVAAMLIPTNDAFIAVDGVKGPKRGKPMEVFSPAYDAGSENNDELCVNIPGPTCGGQGFTEGGGEGFVHIHAGIHGIGNLHADEYDWRNPAVRVVIERAN